VGLDLDIGYIVEYDLIFLDGTFIKNICRDVFWSNINPFALGLFQDVAVTFRKGDTPWLPFRRLESMVAPDWIPGLLVAC
jgi:hypothetical protein